MRLYNKHAHTICFAFYVVSDCHEATKSEKKNLTNPFTCVDARELIAPVAETFFLAAATVLCRAVCSTARSRGCKKDVIESNEKHYNTVREKKKRDKAEGKRRKETVKEKDRGEELSLIHI